MPTRMPPLGLRVHCNAVGNNKFVLDLYEHGKLVTSIPRREAIGPNAAYIKAMQMKDEFRAAKTQRKLQRGFWV